VFHDHVLLVRHPDLGEIGRDRLAAALVEIVVRRPDDGALCRECIDGPVVLVSRAILLLVEDIEKGRVVDVKLVRTDTDDGA
jgi:hypothetical protein